MAVHAPSTAEAPDRREAPRPAAQLVPLSPGAADGLPTLFLVHAIGGTVHPYAALAKALKDTYSVVGIEAFGLYGEGAPVDSLAEIVERYAAAVRAASPDGPYLLGGWSMGGIVAFEMARRLERDGAEVRFVAVLDSPSSCRRPNSAWTAPPRHTTARRRSSPVSPRTSRTRWAGASPPRRRPTPWAGWPGPSPGTATAPATGSRPRPCAPNWRAGSGCSAPMRTRWPTTPRAARSRRTCCC
ncbi:alpha/beta fold hydrolase [Kitasatospora saccharophila]|uniref:alpha/beta fold hydrolase n=1 Tax=Kitasatospora saccharophila TaxID=407973 RepID=UPI003627D5BE